MILGFLVAFAGWGVMVGQTWARVVGIVLAVLSAIVNLSFLAACQVWSTLFIAPYVIVIYALAAHGREVEARAVRG